MEKKVRLDKFLADAGAGTRSEVKKMIQKGQVSVNEVIVRKPEEKISPGEDRISLCGEPMEEAPEFVYYLLHKPAGCVSATEDAREKTVMEYVPKERRGLFPVGRLDKDTEGLLLVTDDGALAHALLSPKKHVDKTYYAVVDGTVTDEDIRRLAEGVDIGEKKPALPGRLVLLRTKEDGTSEIQLTICEGKFHQVKRMMKAVGKRVIYLRRISMGPLTLPKELKPGEYRELTKEEIRMLQSAGKR